MTIQVHLNWHREQFSVCELVYLSVYEVGGWGACCDPIAVISVLIEGRCDGVSLHRGSYLSHMQQHCCLRSPLCARLV